MILRIVRSLFVGLIVSAMIVPALPTMACGPDFSPPIFTEERKPDGPPNAYAAGQLGVVLPTYVQSYLAVAYRYFSGKPLNADEQEQFVTLWDQYYSGYAEPQDSGADTSGWDGTWQRWADSAKVNLPNAPQRNAPSGNGMARLPEMYESYGNCLTDAYVTAANTLRARAQEFGENSPAVQSWVQAQLAVFQNCSTPGAAMPEEAQSDFPLEIRKDREYQIAAAYFYAGKWDEAEKRFLAIATDSSSPWRATAGLVAARCEIRKGTLGTDDSDARDAAFAAADAQLKKIIADPAFSSVRTGAESLRGFAEFRSQPEERAIELSNLLERGDSTDKFAQNIDDYAKLMRQVGGSFVQSQPLREKSDMTDWIVTYANYSEPAAEAHSVARWQQTHSLPWLIASLAGAQKDTPQLAALIQAAARVPQDSPAHFTVVFQKNRALAKTGKQTQARQDIDKILALPQDGIPISSRNLFLMLRMKLALNLQEFLRFAPRRSVVAGGGWETAITEPLFDGDASISLTETMPLSVEIDAARSTVLPATLRTEVAITAWTRAMVLHNDTAAQQIAPILIDLAPQLKAAFAPYNSAKDEESREFAAIFILLKTPGLRPFVGTGNGRQSWYTSEGLAEIDAFRDNWWCSMAPRNGGSAAYNRANPYQQFNPGFSETMYLIYPDRKIPEPGFLSAEERETAAKEWTVLAALPAGPDWLAQEAMAWAKAQPEDPRVPEALHLVVHATRYGCADAKTGDYSKQAFGLLHGQYPNSDWAKQTPYWFR